MGNLLYLAHRLPYPPNKGDKVRSFHLLRHLAAKHRIFLGTFIDDPLDEACVDKLREFCEEIRAVRLSPGLARFGSLRGLFGGEALSLPYYRDGRLRAWVNRTIEQRGIDAAVVFSAAMAQYLDAFPGERTLVDFCDVDSAKWTQYASARRWPLSWIYRREGERLLSFERRIAASAAHSFFSTENETELFLRSAPEFRGKVSAMRNGVDSDYFSPRHEFASPYAAGEIPLVFTGAMDYWPNVDAVEWFAKAIFPRLEARPGVRFHIVGRNPAAAVLALAGERVAVSGTVPDVRPYLRHAAVVVAPLRIARGIQNKVLEAMAMGRPVVVASGCGGAVDAVAGRDFLLADSADEHVRQIGGLLDSPARRAGIGEAARRRVLDRYSWEAHLSAIDPHLAAMP
ncbi:MAG: TIGR03087 family PEP-CTERM/XrtA system glycosyltransferase [Candidatus Accumulibacter sp.]|jgi:sugar transferase (PEP-CTERM/EpsH1 system associated)|nr:TIGR03087 family PEP-CTERM/XrtA system glycosyltransferase [Accumulibacter sp.]